MTNYIIMQTVVNALAGAFIIFQVLPKIFGKSKAEAKSGFNVNYEMKDAGVKGKGIFSLEDIPYGTKVWGLVQGNHSLYRNEEELRKRLEGLSTQEIKHVLTPTEKKNETKSH